MRKFNAVLSVLIIVIFLFHAVMGCCLLTGMMEYSPMLNAAPAGILALLAGIHIIIGIKLTADTVIAQKHSGASYFRENRLFWIRRISGFAVMLLLIAHCAGLSTRRVDGRVVPVPFGVPELLLDLLFAAALLLHISTNIKPLAQAFGFKAGKGAAAGIALAASVFLILCGIAFIIYFAGGQA